MKINITFNLSPEDREAIELWDKGPEGDGSLTKASYEDARWVINFIVRDAINDMRKDRKVHLFDLANGEATPPIVDERRKAQVSDAERLVDATLGVGNE